MLAEACISRMLTLARILGYGVFVFVLRVKSTKEDTP